MYPRMQKRMYPHQSGNLADHFAIGLPGVNFMKRRDDYGGTPSPYRYSMNNTPEIQEVIREEQPSQLPLQQRYSNLRTYPQEQIGTPIELQPTSENNNRLAPEIYKEYTQSNAQDINEYKELPYDINYLKDNCRNQPIDSMNIHEEKDYMLNQRMEQFVKDSERQTPLKYDEAEYNPEINPIERQYPVEMPKDYIGSPKDLISNTEETDALNSNKQIPMDNPVPNKVSDIIEEPFPSKRASADLYRRELEKQVHDKRKAKEDADRVSRSLDLNMLNNVKNEEDRFRREKFDKKHKMQQMTKEAYEQQINEHQNSYTRKYRTIDNPEVDTVGNSIGNLNPINPINTKVYRGNIREIPIDQNGFSIIHDANREEYRKVSMLNNLIEIKKC